MGKVTSKKQELLEVRDTCINCEQEIALDQRYCAYCGGKRMYNRLTWRNLFEDFIDRFLNIENAFLKTFIAMFKQPEDVIVGYTKGMRKKYLPAFSYFAIALTVAGFSAFVMKNWFMESILEAQNALTPGNLGETQLDMNKGIINWSLEYQSVVYFTTIPFMVLISKIVFWKQKAFNWVEHVVIYLYSYSHIAIVTTTIGLTIMWNSTLYSLYGMIILFVQVGYIGYVLKRVFQLESFTMVLKTVKFGCVTMLFIFVIGLFGAGYGVYMALSGKGDSNEKSSSPLMQIFQESYEKGKLNGAAKARAEKLGISVDSAKVLIQQERDSIH